ncbi:hypothetical protein SAMN04489712_115147 [Thermomonospora echinospora]|uniref:DUF6458 domain-containing protein n=1 Tax=Thermomonospora echinospora TaxID=1992 RepID=A0A1H6DD12_9ACTN|nr:DUF6458 family protein [Thermomonospora echinospora]SEG83104.1 hypothetical protein SAMN04489712_115147 [Thermomonospora echinospora]
MGFGTSLAFIAIGAILAFALQIDLSGVNIQMVGWILILVGIASMIFTFAYTRPRRRAATAEIVDEEPVYIVHPEETAAPAEPAPAEPVQPHVHAAPDGRPDPAAPAAPATPVAQPLQRTTGQTTGHVQEPAQPPQPGRHIGEERTQIRQERI